MRSGAGYDYNSLLGMSWLFYEAQRSGKLPRTNRIPWRGDSALGDTAPDGVSSVSGGWYDAGGAGPCLPGAGPMAEQGVRCVLHTCALMSGGSMRDDAVGLGSYLSTFAASASTGAMPAARGALGSVPGRLAKQFV